MNLVKRGAISTLSILMLLAIEILFAVMYEEGNRNEEITVISENVVACSSGEEYLESSRINDMTGYVYTKGTSLWLNGEEYIIQGVCASNGVAASPSVYDIDMMTESDYREIAELGMNTVRFLFNYNLLEDDNNPYVYKKTGWEWIDINLEWAKKYGIHVILDCHLSQGGIPSNGGNTGVWTIGEEKQERLVAMWRAIAERYCNNTIVLGYGLLNEPLIDTNNPSDWHALANRLKDTIRDVDKNHVLIVQRALLEMDRSYVYPELNDSNWVLEIHEYPTVDMKLVKRYFELPESYLYYGNDTIVVRRDKPLEKMTLEYSVFHDPIEISNNWTEYVFEFTAPKGINHAYILFEILNLKESQEIQLSDIILTREDGSVIYNMQYNIKNEYNFYSDKETATMDYLSSENLIKIKGATNYVAFADNSVFRFFNLEENKKYTLRFKLRRNSALNFDTSVNAKIKCYDAEQIYMLDDEFLTYLLNGQKLEESYGVPIYYGEIGIERIGYEAGRGIDKLSNDIITWLVDNECNFTWFTWHEPNYGIYTSSGLDPKNNPNILLLEQMKRALNSN